VITWEFVEELWTNLSPIATVKFVTNKVRPSCVLGIGNCIRLRRHARGEISLTARALPRLPGHREGYSSILLERICRTSTAAIQQLGLQGQDEVATMF
jgi:hypothetical protein